MYKLVVKKEFSSRHVFMVILETANNGHNWIVEAKVEVTISTKSVW